MGTCLRLLPVFLGSSIYQHLRTNLSFICSNLERQRKIAPRACACQSITAIVVRKYRTYGGYHGLDKCKPL